MGKRKDFMGKELAIGDKVVACGTKFKGLRIGFIKGFGNSFGRDAVIVDDVYYRDIVLVTSNVMKIT